MGIFSSVAGGLATGLAGSLLGGSNKSTGSTTTKPWEPQRDLLKEIYGDAQSFYDQGPLPFYGGSTIAPQNEYLTGALNQFGQGYAQPYVNQNYYQIDQLSGAPGAARGAYQSVWDNPLSGVNMNTVNQAINNPVLEGQIDAVGRDVSRNLEDSLAGTRYGSALSGNAGSTTRTLAEGLQAEYAGDRMADISSQMRGDAYQMGYGTAAQQALANQQNRLGIAGGLGQLGNQLQGFIGQGAGLAGGNLEGMAGAGRELGAYDQAQVDEDVQRYYYPQESQRGYIDWLLSIAGRPPGTAGTTSGTAPGLSTVGAGLMGGLSQFGNEAIAGNVNLNPFAPNLGGGAGNYLASGPGAGWPTF